MKDKPTEWVSISDLMAGLMAVVMLLLVISVLQRSYIEKRHKEELRREVESRKNQLTTMLSTLSAALQQQGSGDLISIDINEGKITLRDNVFDRGSACITRQAGDAIRSISSNLHYFLSQSEYTQVLVEGHTDNLPVGKPALDFSRFCTVYDDNYTLTAARAREARNLLIDGIESVEARRVIVAGYGDSQPLKDMTPSDPRNRRVEVHFVAREQNQSR